MTRQTILLLVLVFSIFCFFRFVILDQRIIFGWDQEQFSFQIKNLIKDKDFFLLGPRANNERGFFLGPYFSYLLVPFYLLSNLHPIALLYLVVSYNLVFFVVSYFFINKIFGQKPTLIFLLLWSVNFALITYDTIPWWPLFVPLAVILIWAILFDLYKNQSYRNYVLLGLTLGFFMNFHIQFVFMILFTFIFILLNWKKLFEWKKVLIAVVSFIAMFAPLFLFDLTHNFLNTKWLFDFFMVRTGNPIDPNVWITVFGNFMKPVVYFFNDSLTPFIIIIFAYLFYRLSKKNKSFHQKFYLSTLILWFGTIFGFSRLFAQRPSEYHFVYLYPFIFISLAVFFTEMKYWKLTAVLTALSVVINLPYLPKTLERDPLGMKAKEKAVVLFRSRVDLNKKFDISYDFPLGLNTGYKYFIYWYGIKPSGNPEDPLVEFRNPPHKEDLIVDNAIGVKIPPEVRK